MPSNGQVSSMIEYIISHTSKQTPHSDPIIHKFRTCARGMIAISLKSLGGSHRLYIGVQNLAAHWPSVLILQRSSAG